jgi:hypothetical protein
VAATPAPLADTGTLTQALALLGTVTDAGDAPPELAALHLTRTLVAAAEQQAVAAEHAASKAGGGRLPDGHDVAGHQGTYDLATARAALTMLAVTYWRSQRLNAGVQALARAFTGAGAHDGDEEGRDEEPENSPLELMWDLAVPAAAAAERCCPSWGRSPLTTTLAEACRRWMRPPPCWSAPAAAPPVSAPRSG